ncbi:MAG: tryptophan--tRNA ligase [bacterium]|nr:tryptophan--tRNA ligase [bacterium]
MRIFSGIQPTGAIHIGNYAGAIQNWVRLQDEHECIFCICDYHALTTVNDGERLRRQVADAALDLLACGLDVHKCRLFVQSQVPEHTELAWILSCCASIGELNRMTQFKEKSERSEFVNAGLFTYPILMAADILLYKAELVPVGEDQLQHLEVARVFARHFNNVFGQTFPEPQSRLTAATRVMALNDPSKKMSKSIPGSTIMLTDSDEVIRRQIKKAVTDVGGAGETMSPGVANLFNLLKIFSTPETVAFFEEQYKEGALRYGDLKKTLGDDIAAKLSVIRERRQELAKDPGLVEDMLVDSAKQVRCLARQTLDEVREKVGYSPLKSC